MGRFNITTDKALYQGGDVVICYAEFSKSRPIDIRAVHIDFEIYELAVADKSDKPKLQKVSYLKKRFTVFGGGNKCVELRAGTHSWPFQVQLPANFPSSMLHPGGKAKLVYEFKGIIEAPSSLESYSAQRQIIVKTNQDYVGPIPQIATFRGRKEFLLSKYPLVVDCQIDRSIASPGENVFVDLVIDNQSSKKIDSLAILITQHWKLSTFNEKIIVKDYHFKPPEFPIGPSRQFKGKIGFAIPMNCDPSQNRAKLFSIAYTVDVQCIISGTPELTISNNILIYPRDKQRPQVVMVPVQHVMQPSVNPASLPSVSTATVMPATAPPMTPVLSTHHPHPVMAQGLVAPQLPPGVTIVPDPIQQQASYYPSPPEGSPPLYPSYPPPPYSSAGVYPSSSTYENYNDGQVNNNVTYHNVDQDYGNYSMYTSSVPPQSVSPHIQYHN